MVGTTGSSYVWPAGAECWQPQIKNRARKMLGRCGPRRSKRAREYTGAHERLWLGECSAVLYEASRKGGHNWLSGIAQGERLSCLSPGDKVGTNKRGEK